MVSRISLDREVCPEKENVRNEDGEPSSPASLENGEVADMTVPKQTRQWAAWTRQEEESFFVALRQVGKNFQKITTRVKSKNKNQVRHYYYRLVRRMNKLLGPELSLDATNSKETIAAMLRWWTLLEKHSCKASKLHLKPRRFKMFVDALENQLQRDRKRKVRIRPSTGETNSNSSTGHGPTPAQGKNTGHDNRAAKTVLGDSQNVKKAATGKGSLLKRNGNTNHSNCKGDSTSAKAGNKRKKTGLVATTAYKRWEKAAIAGVSLVADAAEHLERVNTDKETGHVQETPVLGQNDSQHVEKVIEPLPVPPQCVLNENNNNQSAGKLKLQLFPIDESTRMALEMENHNPHLELTLSIRKKISSVVEHLNRKWGNSSLLSKELMLFPYWAQRENLVGFQKWTKDSPLCATDVYYLIGSPPVFRLRYGWFSKAEIELAKAQALSCANQNEQGLKIIIGKEKETETHKRRGSLDDQLVFAEQMTRFLPTNTRESIGPASNIETVGLAATRQVENTKDVAVSAGDWADSLTSISVGDLLSESVQHNMDVNCTEFPMQSTSTFQQMPFSCDSFDAAIAAHIYKHQNKVADLQPQGLSSHGPSIWEAEETCDAFAFQKRTTFCDQVQNPFKNVSPQNNTANPAGSHTEIEELTEIERLADMDMDPTCNELVNECRPVNTSDNLTKDFGGLAEIYWPDSLGPLDLDIPSRKYLNDDLILSDSLGGLSRLIANSMDAFQSCSLLGLDKKEASSGSTVEAHPPASFSDFKISSEV